MGRVWRARHECISYASFLFHGKQTGRQFFSFVISFAYSFFSFVWRPMGVRRQGSPTRTDQVSLGQDMVM